MVVGISNEKRQSTSMKVEDVNRVPVVVMGYLWSMRGGCAPLVVHTPSGGRAPFSGSRAPGNKLKVANVLR